MSSASRRAALDVLTKVGDEFDRINAALEPLAAEFATAVETTGTVAREDLVPLRRTIFAVLAEHRDLVAGAGVVTVPALLADAGYWLEWWWTRASGAPEALRVNLDPTAPDFFDYTTDDWYATPMRTRARHVSGPYVDYACTNQYALTVAVPVHARGEPAGVAAADVPVACLERRILPALCGLDRPMVLVNSGSRVVASSSPDYSPGTRMPEDAQPRITLPPHPHHDRPSPITWHLIPV